MARSIYLSEAIDHFAASRHGDGYAANTIGNVTGTLRQFQRVVGDIQVVNIAPRHVDKFFLEYMGRWGDGTFNTALASLGSFFAWCRDRRITPLHHNPVAGRKYRKVAPTEKTRIPLAKFPALLEAAGQISPRHRFLVSTGLFLFLRVSEVRLLRRRDLDLDSGEITVHVQKTKDLDVMPISSEYDAELRRWLTHYESLHGPLHPDWFLVPSQSRHSRSRDVRGQFIKEPVEKRLYVPTAPIGRAQELVHEAMNAIGLPTRKPDGTSLNEGIHTLRRSGARALYDELVHMGYDGALKRVSSMLHHKSVTMTEHYIGLNEERARRDKDIRGKSLFPSLAADKVLPLSNPANWSTDGRKDRSSA